MAVELLGNHDGPQVVAAAAVIPTSMGRALARRSARSCPTKVLDPSLLDPSTRRSKVRDGERAMAAHIAVGVDMDGVKCPLGIWIQQGRQVLGVMNNRGVADCSSVL